MDFFLKDEINFAMGFVLNLVLAIPFILGKNLLLFI